MTNDAPKSHLTAHHAAASQDILDRMTEARQPSATEADFTEFLGQSTRDRILTGVIQVIERQGVATTTVQHILEAAGYSRRTFYKFFSSKEHALDALYEMLVANLLRLFVRAAEASEDPIEQLIQVVDVYLMSQRLGGPLALTLHTEASRPQSPLYERRARALDAIVTFFDEGVQKALGLHLDPLFYRQMILGLEGNMMHLHRTEQLNDANIDRVRRVFVATLVNTVTQERHPLPSTPQ